MGCNLTIGINKKFTYDNPSTGIFENVMASRREEEVRSGPELEDEVAEEAKEDDEK